VPAGASWTEFEVHDTDGAVRIIARKGDVKLIDASGTTTLAEGQEASRDATSEKGKKKRERGGAVPAAGIGVVGGITAWALIHDDDPVSPRRPDDSAITPP
jgi:hypothetical protein